MCLWHVYGWRKAITKFNYKSFNKNINWIQVALCHTYTHAHMNACTLIMRWTFNLHIVMGLYKLAFYFNIDEIVQSMWMMPIYQSARSLLYPANEFTGFKFFSWVIHTIFSYWPISFSLTCCALNFIKISNDYFHVQYTSCDCRWCCMQSNVDDVSRPVSTFTQKYSG